MDKNNLSKEALTDIAKMMAKLLTGRINPNSVYKKDLFTSFGQHSNVLNTHVGISYYHNDDKFHGNVDGGGHFSGTITSNSIKIICSQSSNRISISY